MINKVNKEIDKETFLRLSKLYKNHTSLNFTKIKIGKKERFFVIGTKKALKMYF